MNIEFVSVCWDECDGCKGEENQPLESKRRGKEVAKKRSGCLHVICSPLRIQ